MSGGTSGVTPIPVRSTSSRSNADRMERAQLRSMVHEDVHKMCVARRELIWTRLTREHPDWDQAAVQAEVDILQPLFEDYDPVVAMAVMSANYEYPAEVRLRAAGESAQYLRPKLKSIEMTVDPMSAEQRERREAMSRRLVDLLDAAAGAKRETVVEGTSRHVEPAQSGLGDQPRSGSSPSPDDPPAPPDPAP